MGRHPVKWFFFYFPSIKQRSKINDMILVRAMITQRNCVFAQALDRKVVAGAQNSWSEFQESA